MKQIVSNYTYSPTTNAVTLTGVNIEQDQLLLIVAPQVGRTLYNFASVTGSVVAGADTRVNLNASTVGLTTTSPLVIFYDDQVDTQTIAGTVTANFPVGEAWAGAYDSGNDCIKIELANLNGDGLSVSNPLPISGTVTANLAPQANGPILEIDSAIPNDPKYVAIVGGFDVTSGETRALQLGSSGEIIVQTLPAISGTVTAAAPNGALTTAFGTPTTASVAFATAAVTKSNRKYLLIQNVTTQSNVITVGIGFTPTTTQGIQLTAGAGITFESSYIPTGQVFILSSVTASNFTILEA